MRKYEGMNLATLNWQWLFKRAAIANRLCLKNGIVYPKGTRTGFKSCPAWEIEIISKGWK